MVSKRQPSSLQLIPSIRFRQILLFIYKIFHNIHQLIMQEQQSNSRKLRKNKANDEASQSCSISADTFTIKAQLSHNCLTLQLNDYVYWRIYRKVYTQKEIGKQINPKLQLEDIYYVFSDSALSPRMVAYKFGKIFNDKPNTFKLEKDGRISVINKLMTERSGKMVQKVFQSELLLSFKSEINEEDKLKVTKTVAETLTKQKCQEQILHLKNEVSKLTEEIKQIKAKSNSQQERPVIYVKTLTGKSLTFEFNPSQTVLDIKEKIRNSENLSYDDQRLIFAGKQLQEKGKLFQYNIQNKSTLHLITRLRGSIGVFMDLDRNSPQSKYLENKDFIKQPRISQIANCEDDKDNNYSTYNLGNMKEKLKVLRHFADFKFNQAESIGAAKDDLEDFKLKITKAQLVNLVEQELCLKLEEMFRDRYDEIIVRRCSAYGKVINFHTDVSEKTLQLCINGDDEYNGGKLVFMVNGQMQTPKRPEGTVTIHNNKIVHGVSRLEGGVRYGLFLLKK